MELTTLKYFIAVAEELHFGRAAQRLHMAQPPLSLQIMKLEHELGVKLFLRTSRKVELTLAGKTFLREARDVLGRAENSVITMRQYASGSRGSLTIGFNEPGINTFLPLTIREFIHRYPEVELPLLELETAEQLAALQTRRIQLGIMRPFGCDLTGLERQLLLREEYLLALPSGHRFCDHSEVELSALKNEPFIMFPRWVNPVLFNRLRECCQNAGFTPKVVQEAISKHTTLALVEAGLGVAMVPESSQHLAPHDVIFKSIIGDLPEIEIYAVWHRDNNPQLIRNFLDIATDCVTMRKNFSSP